MLFNDYFPNFMLCYCNIIEPTMIGSIYANILKLIPTKLSEDRYTTIEFESPDKTVVMPKAVRAGAASILIQKETQLKTTINKEGTYI